MVAQNNPDLAALTAFMQLEAKARSAESEKALDFLMVNDTRNLIPYRQAYLFMPKYRKGRYRIVAASSISVIDRNTPLINWLESFANEVFRNSNERTQQRFDIQNCPEKFRNDWSDFSFPFVLWCPLVLPDKTFVGALWFSRETSWQDNEATLVKRLCDTYAHALTAIVGREKLVKKWTGANTAIVVILLATVTIFLKPVHMSTLAPVEVVAIDPVIVTAPMDGVIAEILVKPNTEVIKGQTIIRYEDTALRNGYQVAEQSLSVALAELRKASQGAFMDPKSKAEVALLRAEVDLHRAERDYSLELLNQVEIRASKDGVLIYTEQSDWIGRPVVVGERIMEIADPASVEMRIDLPVGDAIVISQGATVDVFLDVDPLHPTKGVVRHVSYNAALTPENVLAYRVNAKFIKTPKNVRIGLQGTAKIYGSKVTLFFYLFRRPISTLRQFLGL